MKKDKHKTKVQFLVNTYHFGGRDDVFAYFPEEPYSKEVGIFNSYSHIGQHSACHEDYAKESRPATIEEYADLKEELEGLGYNLTILP